MDESWRRRRSSIQTNKVDGYLGPDDFRDVFGGPPRSVLLRHFSPSTQHADNRFRTVKREDNPPYNTVFCEPEFVSTIRCGRGGFSITRREPEMANQSVFYKPSLATSTCYGDNDLIRNRKENLHYNETLHNLDHVSTTSSARKREEHPPLIPFFHKDGLSTNCDDHNSFRVMERDDGSSYDTRSDLNASTHIALNGFRDIKNEIYDTCSEDAFVYRPVSGQHPSPWSGSIVFPALKREEGFYSDIFGPIRGEGNAGSRRSRSRSISKCESDLTAVSCCEEGLLANSFYSYEGDGVLSSYASKLRPITIPSKHYDSTPPSTISEGDDHSTLQYAGPPCPSSPITYVREGANSRNSNLNTKNKSRCAASSFCCFTPPETLSLDPSFRLSFKKLTSPENNSPPSVISLSVPHKAREVEKKVVLEVLDHVKTEEEQNFGSEVSAALDEAIAWAKERFMIQDDSIEHKNENFVSFKDWNGTEGRHYAYSKER